MSKMNYAYEPKEFEDGMISEIKTAIQKANRLKLIRDAEVLELNEDCETPYFAHLYWAIQHEYDMYEEYASTDYGENWIETMTPSNWKSVKKWLNDHKDVFVQSAIAHDKRLDTHDKFGYTDTSKVCSMKELMARM